MDANMTTNYKTVFLEGSFSCMHFAISSTREKKMRKRIFLRFGHLFRVLINYWFLPLFNQQMFPAAIALHPSSKKCPYSNVSQKGGKKKKRIIIPPNPFANREDEMQKKFFRKWRRFKPKINSFIAYSTSWNFTHAPILIK